MVKPVYKEENVKGLLFTEDGMRFVKVTVRFTTDSHGETLSLCDDRRGIMISVAYEEIEKIIKEARGDKNSRI